MGCGKDTATSYLIAKYGGVRMTFADPIYAIQKYAQDVCGFRNTKDRQFLR